MIPSKNPFVNHYFSEILHFFIKYIRFFRQRSPTLFMDHIPIYRAASRRGHSVHSAYLIVTSLTRSVSLLHLKLWIINAFSLPGDIKVPIDSYNLSCEIVRGHCPLNWDFTTSAFLLTKRTQPKLRPFRVYFLTLREKQNLRADPNPRSLPCMHTPSEALRQSGFLQPYYNKCRWGSNRCHERRSPRRSGSS